MTDKMTDQLFDTSKEVVGCIMDVIAGHGVRHVVCSPGSRNVPLIMAVRARRELIKHIVIDERSAAFMALGISSVTQQPVALICTSGTALLNYAPAIAEAYYRGIPLIVISADRPKEWIDQDDSQTLRQFEVMRNYVKGSYDISDREKNDAGMWYVNRTINDAMLTANRDKKGPVHINIRLSPPLNELSAENIVNRASQRIIQEIAESPLPPKETIKDLARNLLGKRVMVTVGFHSPDAVLNKALLKMRRHGNVVIMAETISNTHLPVEDYAIDSLLCLQKKGFVEKDLIPDVVISIGGAMISRMLKEFLRRSAGKGTEHWSVGYHDTTVDCFQSLSKRIEAHPGKFISALSAEMAHLKRISEMTLQIKANKNNSADDYSESFSRLRSKAMSRISEFEENSTWSELWAFSKILKSLPQDYNLYLSNGTAIRYTQLIPHRLPHASFCNRGVSGIEGSTSTAVGGALAYKGKSLLISGDMSFAYDLGGFSLAGSMDANLDIIVINNAGGGIFRFIESTSELPDREYYLCANPNLNLESLASTFNYDYMIASSAEDLEKKLSLMFSKSEFSKRKLLEVRVPAEMSAKILRRILK